jgi:hypothetical protein
VRKTRGGSDWPKPNGAQPPQRLAQLGSVVTVGWEADLPHTQLAQAFWSRQVIAPKSAHCLGIQHLQRVGRV